MEAHWIGADLTTTAGVDAVRAAVEAVGGLELVVNNAGITRDARLVNLTEDQMMTVLDVNLGAPLQLIDALAPLMETGSIVNVSSRAYLGNFGQFNYSMSKGGLVGLTRALALELAPQIESKRHRSRTDRDRDVDGDSGRSPGEDGGGESRSVAWGSRLRWRTWSPSWPTPPISPVRSWSIGGGRSLSR